MFVLNDDNSIFVTRGDIAFFYVCMEEDEKEVLFVPGDIVRIKVFGKKDADNVVLQKDFPVTEETALVGIFLDREDTKFEEVISKPKDYWYEIVLNDDTLPQTIVGYDEDGAKLFKLFPEGGDLLVPETNREESSVAEAYLPSEDSLMSFDGTSRVAKTIRGKIVAIPEEIHVDVYEFAVKHGFEGTIEDFFEVLFGRPVASKTQVGGIKVGAFLEISEDGVLDVVPKYKRDGGETYTETFHLTYDDWTGWDEDSKTKTFYLSHKVKSIVSWSQDDDGDFLGSTLHVSDDGGVYFQGHIFDDYNGNGNEITITYISDEETVFLVDPVGGDGGKNITDQVRVAYYGDDQEVIKAVDNGNTITILIRGGLDELSVYMEGRTERLVSASLYYNDGMTQVIFPFCSEAGSEISYLNLYGTAASGTDVVSGIVIHYV